MSTPRHQSSLTQAVSLNQQSRHSIGQVLKHVRMSDGLVHSTRIRAAAQSGKPV